MVCAHTVRRVQSPSRTARDRRPATISIKYAAHCHGKHFPLFVNYQNFGDDRMIVTSKCAIKYIETYLIFFFNSPPIFPHNFSLHTLSLYFLFDMSYNSTHLRTNYINFSSISEDKNRQHSLQANTPKCKWKRRKTIHIIGIEQVQTGTDPFRHSKHSRSASATERNWDVTEDAPVSVNISV
jgi:hypothetical protein